MKAPLHVVILLTPDDVEALRRAASILNEVANKGARANLSEVVPVGENNLVIKRRQGEILCAIKQVKE